MCLFIKDINRVEMQRVKGQPSSGLSISYLVGGGTLGERDRARLISADREQWFDDITCSGTDNVELWKSLPFGRKSEKKRMDEEREGRGGGTRLRGRRCWVL